MSTGPSWTRRARGAAVWRPASRARRRSGAETRAAGAARRSRQHHEGGVEDRDDGSDPHRQPVAQDRQQLVAGTGLVEGSTHRRLRAGAPQTQRPGQGEDRGPPASSWNAPALPRRTSRTSGVPGSGRKPISPAPPVAPSRTPAVDHDGRTEAVVHPQQHEVLDAPGDAGGQLGDGGEVDVVVDVDRDARPRRRDARAGPGRASPAGAGRSAAAASSGRRRPASRWRGGARSRRQPGGRGGAVDRLDHVAHGVRARAARGAQLVLADGTTGEVGHRGQDPGRGDVERGHMGGVRVDGVELGARSGTTVGDPARDHQAGLFEPGEELARRRLGESGEVAELRPREGSVLEEEVQGGAVVDAAQHPWGVPASPGPSRGMAVGSVATRCRADGPACHRRDQLGLVRQVAMLVHADLPWYRRRGVGGASAATVRGRPGEETRVAATARTLAPTSLRLPWPHDPIGKFPNTLHDAGTARKGRADLLRSHRRQLHGRGGRRDRPRVARSAAAPRARRAAGRPRAGARGRDRVVAGDDVPSPRRGARSRPTSPGCAAWRWTSTSGSPHSDPRSYHSFVLREIAEPLGIPAENVLVLDGNAVDPAAECVAFEDAIHRWAVWGSSSSGSAGTATWASTSPAPRSRRVRASRG